MHFDLNELAQRESEQVEWKENVADFTDVVKTLVAFANDFANLGGGYVVCGAREVKNEHGFPSVEMIGMTASRCKELEGKILDHCTKRVVPPIAPQVQVVEGADPSLRLLVFVSPATRHVHAYQEKDGVPRCYYRLSSNTKEARNGHYRELLVQKGATPQWDHCRNDDAGIDDLDLLVLREVLREAGLWQADADPMRYLKSGYKLHALVDPLTETVPLREMDVPRNFALLLFGKEPTRFIRGAYAVFSIYPGSDRGADFAERVEVFGPLMHQARELIKLLNAEATTAFDKTSERPNQVKYPLRALQEAVVNALVHRDYTVDQPVRITVFSDRIEIVSPGGLLRTIDPEAFRAGKSFPVWRNQGLSWFFNKLQLAQAEGQGIPTILRTMSEEGCPVPVFELKPDFVKCTLPAHPRHKAMEVLAQAEKRIILGEYEQARSIVGSLLEEDPYNFRGLELFCRVNTLLGTPERLYYFLEKHTVDPFLVDPGTVLLVARTLAQVDQEGARQAARQWNNAAQDRRLQAVEVKQLALNYRKLGADEDAVDLINNFLMEGMDDNLSANLLDIRAKAKIDLAKKCMETGRNPGLGTGLRAKAWDTCRRYLEEAESDLTAALNRVAQPHDRDYILRDLAFLETMKDFARKPTRSPRRRK